MNDGRDGGTVQQGLQPTRRRGPGRPFTGRDDPRRNSGGRRATPISAALARLLTEDDAERIASMAIGRAMAGEPWFVQFVTERLEGKAVARTESGEPGQFVDLEDITIEQLRKALKLVP
jgi:hypothetical protein